jgi:hypothetical protein
MAAVLACGAGAALSHYSALRDQTHFKAEIRTLRFIHWQIWHEPDYVESVLRTA